MIQRYIIENDEPIEDDEGDFVLFSDHVAEVERLTEQYQAMYRECEELAKENKRLKEALERIGRLLQIGMAVGIKELKSDLDDIDKIAKEALDYGRVNKKEV